MGSKPITARAAAKVYANTVAKAIGDDDLMSTGTGDKKLSNNNSSPDPKPSGTPEAVKDIQVSQTGGYGDVFYPKSPFYGGGFDTGLDTSNVGTSSEPPSLLDSNKEMVESKNQSVEVEMPEVDMTPIEKPKFISSGTGDTGDSGRFVGPYERRQRQRAVRKTARDRKRGMIKEARLTGGDVSEARRQAKLAKARDIKAEAERMAGSNVDAYKTKFRGSGDPAAASNKFKSIGTEVANTDFSIKRNSRKPSLTTKTTSSEQRIQNFRSLTGEDDKATLGSGVNKKASSPIFKMGGYGNKTYK